MRWLLCALGICLLFALFSSFWLARPAFDERIDAVPATALKILPATEALTLARTRKGSVLLVNSADVDGVSGIDLDVFFATNYHDALDAFERVGVTRLQRLFASAPVLRHIGWEALDVPVDAAAAIAAGTNYAAHAEEVNHQGEPFLFPKLATATAWNAPVDTGTRLDYEVEVCAVPVTAYRGDELPTLGYLLCNDLTDRWALVRDIDLDGPMGRTGFAVAKGGNSRLPVGPLLVVPASPGFYRRVEIGLAVNGQVRQRSLASAMLWSPEEILQRAFEQCSQVYDNAGQAVSLADCGAIEPGTLLLTGTPAGVMFHPATIWAPWAYLRNGDTVRAWGTSLGMLHNVVTKH